MRDWNQFFTEDEVADIKAVSKSQFPDDFRSFLNAKIREALEAAPKVYDCDGMNVWTTEQVPVDTHVGRLIDVKPIEKGE